MRAPFTLVFRDPTWKTSPEGMDFWSSRFKQHTLYGKGASDVHMDVAQDRVGRGDGMGGQQSPSAKVRCGRICVPYPPERESMV